jgi:hypothetical protein
MILATKAAAASAAESVLDYRWVIAGTTGTLRTSDSTTADSWTSQTSGFSTSQIYGVASNGTSLYVAVGVSGKLATSPDGITWTLQTSSFGADRINGIAYGNGTWVAVGTTGKIATSTDGVNWTQQTSGTTEWFYAVAYGDGLWIAAGANFTMVTATDPTSTWTSRTTTIDDNFNNLLYYWPEQAIWVSGLDTGTTGALQSSTDGTTWTARTSAVNIAFRNGGFTSTGSVLVLAFRLSATPTCDIQSSTNGTTWTDRTPADTTEDIASACVDDAGFMIAVGTKIQSSTDGTTWTDRGASGVTIA